MRYCVGSVGTRVSDETITFSREDVEDNAGKGDWIGIRLKEIVKCDISGVQVFVSSFVR